MKEFHVLVRRAVLKSLEISCVFPEQVLLSNEENGCSLTHCKKYMEYVKNFSQVLVVFLKGKNLIFVLLCSIYL